MMGLDEFFPSVEEFQHFVAAAVLQLSPPFSVFGVFLLESPHPLCLLFGFCYGVLEGYMRVFPSDSLELKQFVVVSVDDGHFVGEEVGDY